VSAPNPSPETRIALFQRQEVRRTIHNNEWWFVIADAVAALTDSVDPQGYIKDMRRRDRELSKGWGQIATPLSIQTEDADGLKIIYIDPPFDAGADFSMDVEIGGETFHKAPNRLEQFAYRDTWGRHGFLHRHDLRTPHPHARFARKVLVRRATGTCSVIYSVSGINR
jgi:hypothetical protein